MNFDNEEESKTMLAMRLGIPARVLNVVNFAVLHAALSMFISLRDLYLMEAGDFLAVPRNQKAIDRFIFTWSKTNYNEIIFGDAGTLFKGFGTADERLTELEAIPGLKSQGLGNDDFVRIVRNGQRFSIILEALENNVPTEYAFAI